MNPQKYCFLTLINQMFFVPTIQFLCADCERDKYCRYGTSVLLHNADKLVNEAMNEEGYTGNSNPRNNDDDG